MAKLKWVGEFLYFSLSIIFANSWYASYKSPSSVAVSVFFFFSSYWVYRKRNGDDFGKEPRCKVDAFDNISARVASLQSLKLDVFALQGLKPAADLRCHVLLEARGVYNR